ncbi:hypothetical protein G4B88_012052 [Cannabis sativa]|uniref:Uncharacterized protein n=1 Tax=Cannabis sativa TaxID=3483 RepID=A0A7J6HCJ6_CANSA|nr:hypothetical protein G4B88_012052 [Cannabis sativa]
MKVVVVNRQTSLISVDLFQFQEIVHLDLVILPSPELESRDGKLSKLSKVSIPKSKCGDGLPCCCDLSAYNVTFPVLSLLIVSFLFLLPLNSCHDKSLHSTPTIHSENYRTSNELSNIDRTPPKPPPTSSAQTTAKTTTSAHHHQNHIYTPQQSLKPLFISKRNPTSQIQTHQKT